jgi:crotonobetainyl-CoA:carnitine CoA-transferase CaiB-like acyl-CoA transferase
VRPYAVSHAPTFTANIHRGETGSVNVPNETAEQDAARVTGPLAGIRIIDLTAIVLGPMATQILGDMGADVIKVEPPGGESLRRIGPCRTPGMGAYYANLNRNKRSVALDLKRPAAHAALMRLVEGADVVVHNMRLDAARRLGIDYATLAARNPRIILASATGFRADGPYADRPAFDDMIQGMSGLAALNRDERGAPRYLPSVVADKLCGHVLASSIAMALFHRERSGQGQEVHVPMLETAIAFTMVEHMWGMTIEDPSKGVGYTRMLSPHRRPFATADGHICVIAVTDAQWRTLFGVIGRPELMQDPRFADMTVRADHVDALYGTLAEALTARTTAEWVAAMDAAGVPNGPVHTLEGLFEDEYLRETGFFRHLHHPVEGRTLTAGIPVHFSATPGQLRRPPPLAGEHTAEVLRESGLGAAEIAAAMEA